MNYLIGTLLGILQGLTEFLPVSSSGHLVLIRHIFSWPDQGLAFDVVLHLGTLLAVFIALYKQWWQVLKGFFSFLRTGKLWSTPDQKLFSMLVTATIPAALAGFFLNSFVEDNFRGLLSLGLFFAALGSFYFFVEFSVQKRESNRTTFWGAVWIGLAQVLSLLPGVSRSGMTLAAGMLTGGSRIWSARFAFLLSGPIVAGAAALSLVKLLSGSQSLGAGELGPLLVGSLAAFAVGWLSIKGMLKFLRTKTLKPFAVYLLLLGLSVIVLYFTNIIK